MTMMVELKDASKAYQGVPAVKGVDLQVRRGERLAVIGPNGAGKSTLFGMIAGEHRPTGGSVWFEGRDVTSHYSSRRARAGMSRTFQVARLLPTMSVRENLFLAALTGQRRGVRFWDAWSNRSDVRQEAEAAMELAGLADLAGVTADSLAQGARKTLEMAMAIVQQPTLLLLDEPTAGMGYDDARIATQQLRDLLEERREMTIILTAHDMEVIHSIAERVVLMANGEVVLDGSPEYVAEHAVTKELYLGRGA